jgi:hypothetical protein
MSNIVYVVERHNNCNNASSELSVGKNAVIYMWGDHYDTNRELSHEHMHRERDCVSSSDVDAVIGISSLRKEASRETSLERRKKKRVKTIKKKRNEEKLPTGGVTDSSSQCPTE